MKINIIKNTKIYSTPFSVLTKENGKSMIAIGNQIISEEKETEEECIKMIENRDWELILNASFAFNNLVKEYKNENKNKKNSN